MTAEQRLTIKTCPLDKTSCPQTAVAIILLEVTSKLCLLPSIIAEQSRESGFWAIFVLLLADIVVAIPSIRVASAGGLKNVNVHPFVRKLGATILLILYTLKFTAFCYEISSAISGALFDSAVILPLFALLTVGVIYIGSKGFTGVLRLSTLTFWICAILLTINLFFINFSGNFVNLFAILRPKNTLGSILSGAVWFGDSSVILLFDGSSTANDKKGRKLIWASIAVSALTVLGYYLLMIFTYGSAVRYLGSAFSRVLLMNKTASELGALDWPPLVVWLILAILDCSLLFAAVKKCYSMTSEALSLNKKLGFLPLYIIMPIISFTLYYFVYRNRRSYIDFLTSKPISITALSIEYLTPLAIFLIAWIRRSHKRNLTPNE